MRWLTLSLEATISASSQPIYRKKMQDYWLKNDTSSLGHRDGKLFSNYVVPQHSKDGNSSRKCTASFIRRQNHNGEVVERIS